MNLVERRNATLVTVERFKAKRIDWSKAATCIHMARTQLDRMGHAVPPVPMFRSRLSATREMNKRGWGSLADIMDSVPTIYRIPPAAALIGDILELDSAEDRFGSLVVVIGNGRVLGWLEGVADALILQPQTYKTGWRL